MPLKIWTEFVCENCAKADAGKFLLIGKRIKTTDVKIRLNEIGWIYSKSYVWCSMACMQDMLLNQEKQP